MRPGKSLTRIFRLVGVLVALCPVVVAGCGGEDSRPATFSYIYPAIIEPSCATASCHSDFTRRAGVNFGFKSEAYYQLTQRNFVSKIKGEAAWQQSELYYLLTAQGARRMPPDFALPNVDIETIGDWVRGGANDD
jgi:hypothetical protein